MGVRSKVDERSIHALRQILTPAVPSSNYTVLSENDVSFARIQRISVKALVNGTATKADKAAIVRKLTADRTSAGRSRDKSLS